MQTFSTELGTAFNVDCFDIMKMLPDGCVDMILADMPYGTTACKWDTVIPFEPMWKQYKRIIKNNGAIVLTASQPFTSALIMSNVKMFKHEWVWDKVIPRGHLVAKKRPMQQTESAVIFCIKSPIYNPQMTEREKLIKGTEGKRTTIMGGTSTGYSKVYTHKYPTNLIRFKPDKDRLHPTQKPLALFEYLIRTYTNEDDLVFDPTAGSLTTGVAAENLKRRWVVCEIDEGYFNSGITRFNKL